MNFQKKDCIAMLLAGGQGSRLMVLTENTAKPAVPFGGKYRIIDFPLSNCVNSGIDTVGILTQYQPLELNEYIGNGQPWGLNSSQGGIHVLPPYARSKKSEWYKGTANAIYQNLKFIERYDPDDVLILSGDHIYIMDYSDMLSYHKEKDASCTIAVLDVPLEEASRFGIMNTREDNSVYEFEEKPKKPKSTKASMGIYIFKWQVLKDYLIADEQNEKSDNDFGKNIIPALLNDNHKLYAYQFDGYWKDVGTISSLWDANLDLLNPKVDLDLNDDSWRIYSRSPASPPHYIGADAAVENSMITEGCEINGKIDFSVLFANVTVEEGAEVKYSIVMPGTVIKKGATVQYSIVAENAVIEEGAVVGESPENMEDIEKWGVAVIGNGVTIGKGSKIAPDTMTDSDVGGAE